MNLILIERAIITLVVVASVVAVLAIASVASCSSRRSCGSHITNNSHNTNNNGTITNDPITIGANTNGTITVVSVSNYLTARCSLIPLGLWTRRRIIDVAERCDINAQALSRLYYQEQAQTVSAEPEIFCLH